MTVMRTAAVALAGLLLASATACSSGGCTAGDRPRWVVVSLQDGFPLEITEWDERPAYG